MNRNYCISYLPFHLPVWFDWPLSRWRVIACLDVERLLWNGRFHPRWLQAWKMPGTYILPAATTDWPTIYTLELDDATLAQRMQRETFKYQSFNSIRFIIPILSAFDWVNVTFCYFGAHMIAAYTLAHDTSIQRQSLRDVKYVLPHAHQHLNRISWLRCFEYRERECALDPQRINSSWGFVSAASGQRFLTTAAQVNSPSSSCQVWTFHFIYYNLELFVRIFHNKLWFDITTNFHLA